MNKWKDENLFSKERSLYAFEVLAFKFRTICIYLEFYRT